MTTKLAPEEYLGFWEKAAEQEIGIEVLVQPEDQMKFINALYECRSTFGGFEDISVFQPQPPGTIFIMKRSVELPA
jgi:hypothetical protein